MKCFADDTEEYGVYTGTIAIRNQSYYYAFAQWYSPEPIPTVETFSPVRTPSATELTEDQLVTQGILYLYGNT